MNEELTRETPKTGWNRKRVFVFAAGLLAAVIAGTLYVAFLPKEPSYNGKPLTYWLKHYQSVRWHDPNDAKLVESREAIRHIGTNAIPTFLRMLRAKDSALKTKLMEWNDEHDSLHLHFVPAEDQNMLAAAGFYCLRELATNAIPALINIYKHKYSPYSKSGADSALMECIRHPARPIPIGSRPRSARIGTTPPET